MTNLMAMVIMLALLIGCAGRSLAPAVSDAQTEEEGEEELTILNWDGWDGNLPIPDKCKLISNYGGLAKCFQEEAANRAKQQVECEDLADEVKCGPKGAPNHGKVGRQYIRLAKKFRRCQKGITDPCAALIQKYEAAAEQQATPTKKKEKEKNK